MNKVIILGRLTRDPEQRQSQTGVEVSTFTLAVNRQFKNKDGEYGADFIRCVAFRKTAELVGQYLSKGSQCAVDGRLQTRSYEKDGQRQTITEIVADRVQFIGGKASDQSQQAGTDEKKGQIDPYDINSDDLPF